MIPTMPDLVYSVIHIYNFQTDNISFTWEYASQHGYGSLSNYGELDIYDDKWWLLGSKCIHPLEACEIFEVDEEIYYSHNILRIFWSSTNCILWTVDGFYPAKR